VSDDGALTANTITDEQIREMRIGAESPSSWDPETAKWASYGLGLGDVRDEGRARCAEILNARATDRFATPPLLASGLVTARPAHNHFTDGDIHMTKTAEPVSDALVDTYRALHSMNTKTASAVITPGAGVDPKRVVRPSKRVRAWHRGGLGHTLGGQPVGTRRMAGAIAEHGNATDKPIAVAWFANKKAT
jgi:hypothetical protein